MAAPVVVGPVITTVTIIDSHGNLVGTAENPLQFQAPSLLDALGDVIEELHNFKEMVKLIASS